MAYKTAVEKQMWKSFVLSIAVPLGSDSLIQMYACLILGLIFLLILLDIVDQKLSCAVHTTSFYKALWWPSV